ncbi:hypothetical protein ACGH7X_41615 [Streptomyces sp. BBFR51]|uniref:hypothetical protein n=1 Tax=Streptomyces sp. BBFR51 TaxID=3372856 RepID=UPI0037DC00C6
MSVDDPETLLREALDSIAGTVVPSRTPTPERAGSAGGGSSCWVLAVLIVAVADAVGLWALNFLGEPDVPPRHGGFDVVVPP